MEQVASACVTISAEEYLKLQQAAAILDSLAAYGVDNEIGYCMAVTEARKNNPELFDNEEEE